MAESEIILAPPATTRAGMTLMRSPLEMMSTLCGENDVTGTEIGITTEGLGIVTITKHLVSPR